MIYTLNIDSLLIEFKKIRNKLFFSLILGILSFGLILKEPNNLFIFLTYIYFLVSFNYYLYNYTKTANSVEKSFIDYLSCSFTCSKSDYSSNLYNISFQDTYIDKNLDYLKALEITTYHNLEVLKYFSEIWKNKKETLISYMLKNSKTLRVYIELK